MTTFETIFYMIGLFTALIVGYLFFFKHVIVGVIEGAKEAKEMLFLEYSDEIKNNWSQWDKLWLVPKVFRLWFFRGFISSISRIL